MRRQEEPTVVASAHDTFVVRVKRMTVKKALLFVCSFGHFGITICSWWAVNTRHGCIAFNSIAIMLIETGVLNGTRACRVPGDIPQRLLPNHYRFTVSSRMPRSIFWRRWGSTCARGTRLMLLELSSRKHVLSFIDTQFASRHTRSPQPHFQYALFTTRWWCL